MKQKEFKEENQKLLDRYYNTADEDEKRKIAADIVEFNYKLICKIVNTEWGWYNEPDELVSIACTAVMEKIDRYKPDVGTAFWTYMGRYIQQYIFKYFAKTDMHSYDIGLRINRIKKCVQEYFPEYYGKPELYKDIASQIADKLNRSEYEIRSAIDALNKSNVVSLDDMLVIPAANVQPENSAMIGASMDELADIIRDFGDEDKEILMCIYEGYDTNETDTINNRLGTSYTQEELQQKIFRLKNRIRQIYRKKKKNKVNESDDNNNVYNMSPDRIMDIIDGIFGD